MFTSSQAGWPCSLAGEGGTIGRNWKDQGRGRLSKVEEALTGK